MKADVAVTISGAKPAEVFEHIATLDRYPAWMRLVHRVEGVEPDEGRLAWWVELRARVGPFARSKQLRMVRTVHVPDRSVRFERVQFDERDHANWILTADLDELPAVDPTAGRPGDRTVEGGVRLRVQLEYTGSLWTGGVLGRILDEEIRHGSDSLRRAVSEAPRR